MNKHFKRAENQLEMNKSLEIIKSTLKMAFIEKEQSEWLEEQQGEYLLVFPENEKVAFFNPELQVEEFKNKKIDYSNDENYLTFDEWINQETKIENGVYLENDDGTSETIEEPVYQKIREFKEKDNYENEINEYLKPKWNAKIYALADENHKNGLRSLFEGYQEGIKRTQEKDTELRSQLIK